jgi:MFS family permease
VRRWFPLLLLITVLLQTVVYAIRPMVSYKALAVGGSAFDIGIIASAFAVLSLFVAVPLGRWVDRWGETPFVLIGAGAVAAAALSLLWLESIPGLAASQALLGLGHIATVVGSQTLVANAGDPRSRDGRFGVFTVAVSLGQLAGPAAAGLLAGAGTGVQGAASEQAVSTGPVFVAATATGAIGVLAAAVLWWRARRRQRDRAESRSENGASMGAATALAHVLRIPSMPNAMLTSLTVLTTIDLIAAYLPAYGEANGLSAEMVGLLLAARAGASMASRLLMMPLIRLLQRRRLLILSTALPAVCLAAFPLLNATQLLFLAMVLIGFGLGLGQPITLAWVADRASADLRGTAIGVRLSGNRLGQAVLPAAVGVVAGAGGVAAVFICLAGLLGLSAAAVMAANFESGSAEPPPG